MTRPHQVVRHGHFTPRCLERHTRKTDTSAPKMKVLDNSCIDNDLRALVNRLWRPAQDRGAQIVCGAPISPFTSRHSWTRRRRRRRRRGSARLRAVKRAVTKRRKAPAQKAAAMRRPNANWRPPGVVD